MASELYDILKPSESSSDGIMTVTYSPIETTRIEVQPMRFNRHDKGAQYAIDVEGERYIPNFWGILYYRDTDITAGYRITPDSGTTQYLVLRVYDYDYHYEVDLRRVDD